MTRNQFAQPPVQNRIQPIDVKPQSNLIYPEQYLLGRAEALSNFWNTLGYNPNSFATTPYFVGVPYNSFMDFNPYTGAQNNQQHNQPNQANPRPNPPLNADGFPADLPPAGGPPQAVQNPPQNAADFWANIPPQFRPRINGRPAGM